jgi:ABC-type proline/glycine betaine transport system permease subunit
VDHSERPGSTSLYDYRDKSIQHAWIATLGYAAAKIFGTLIAILQGVRDLLVIGTVVIELMIILFLAFWISRKSRVAAVLMLAYVIGIQLYVWLGMHSFSGTVVSVIVAGFLLRGTKRIFEEHSQSETDRISDKKSDTA